MRTARCSGLLSCHARPPVMHAPRHTCAPLLCTPLFAIHAPLAMHVPFTMNPLLRHACPFAMHAPALPKLPFCHAPFAIHTPLAMHTPLCHHSPLCMYVPPLPCIPPLAKHAPRSPRTPPLNRMTDACENITLPQTPFAGGNKQLQRILILQKIPNQDVLRKSCLILSVKGFKEAKQQCGTITIMMRQFRRR